MEVYLIDNELKLVASREDTSNELAMNIAKHLADKLCGEDKNDNFHRIIKDIYLKIVTKEVQLVGKVVNATSGMTYYIDIQKTLDHYIEAKIKNF